MVKGRPQRPEWRQERDENCIRQLVGLQKEPSLFYIMYCVYRVVKCHKVIWKLRFWHVDILPINQANQLYRYVMAIIILSSARTPQHNKTLKGETLYPDQNGVLARIF
jgi:hypothetical protein